MEQSNQRKKMVLGSKERELVARVYEQLKHEAENGVERLADARWRTSKAVGVSERTVSRILKEKRDSESTGNAIRSPHKNKKPRTCLRRQIDSFDMSVIKRTINNFHKDYNQFVTLKKLRTALSEKINFRGCTETLRQIVLSLGYEWISTENNRRTLVEKHDIRMLRFKYLTQLKKFRKEGRNVIYTIETYVHTTHVQNKSWSLEKRSLSTKSLSKGTRVIIVHAGGKNGFVPNAFLIYKANTATGDYHDNMNHENYTKWFTTQLLPNVPKKTVIVMDNASYHNTLAEKIPTSNNNKPEMQEWLKNKNIPFAETMKKIELYDLILKNKEDHKMSAINALAKQYDCDVLRLPPYHPDLNPIEKIWGVLKNDVANKNVEQNYRSMVGLIHERLNAIDSHMWEQTCRHVEETEDIFWGNYEDGNEFIIHVDDSESENDISSDINTD